MWLESNRHFQSKKSNPLNGQSKAGRKSDLLIDPNPLTSVVGRRRDDVYCAQTEEGEGISITGNGWVQDMLAGTEDKKEASDFYQKLKWKQWLSNIGSAKPMRTANELRCSRLHRESQDTVGAGDGFAVVSEVNSERLNLKDSKRGNAIGAISNEHRR